MIKVTDNNNTEHFITTVMKGGHEMTRIYQNGKLVYSPFLMMGTTYEVQNQTIQYTALDVDFEATFEVLGEAGTDTGGTYYNFGLRMPRKDVNGNAVTMSSYHFKQYCEALMRAAMPSLNIRSVNLWSSPFIAPSCCEYFQGATSGRSNIKEIDFKDFNLSNCSAFRPALYCAGLTSVLNMDYVRLGTPCEFTTAFRGCTSLTSIDFSVGGSKYINSLFRTSSDCSSLQSIIISYADADNTLCTSIAEICTNDTNLTRCDIANLRMKGVTTAASAFEGCTSLTTDPLADMDTSTISVWDKTYAQCPIADCDKHSFDSATNLRQIHYANTAVTAIDWSGKDMHNVTTLNNALNGCTNLATIKFPTAAGKICAPQNLTNAFSGTAITAYPQGLSFSNCVTMDAVFSGCTSMVGAVDLSSFDLSHVTKAGNAFDNTRITSLSLPASNSTSNCSDFSSLVYNNSVITTITNLNMTAATNLNNICSGCTNLQSITGTKSSAVLAGMNGTFQDCYKLETIPDLSGTKLQDGIVLTNSFGNCYKLKTNPHFETWKGSDGISGPTVSTRGFLSYVGRDLSANEYWDIDLTGWTLRPVSNQIFIILSNTSCPTINIDKIKVRPYFITTANKYESVYARGTFSNSNIAEIDTTNWFDNQDDTSETKIPIRSNYNFILNCPNLTKVIIKNLYWRDGDAYYSPNSDVISGCPNITHFECEVDFFDVDTSTIFDLSSLTQWTNSAQISAFLTQLTTRYSKRYLNDSTVSLGIKLSTQTYTAATALSNWSSLITAITAHGWDITT